MLRFFEHATVSAGLWLQYQVRRVGKSRCHCSSVAEASSFIPVDWEELAITESIEAHMTYHEHIEFVCGLLRKPQDRKQGVEDF